MQKKKLKINPNYKYRGNYQRYIQGVTVIERKGPIVKIIPHIYILGDVFKKCNKCGYWKSLDVFNNSKSTLDRKHTVCKDCIRKRTGRSKGRPKGYIMSEETKEKISRANLGKVLSFEHKKRISKKMLGNTNRRTDFSTLVDNLFEDYVKSYSDERIGQWINENKETLEKAGIKSEHELNSMTIRDVNLFDMPCSDIASIDPLEFCIIQEELNQTSSLYVK